MFRTFLIRTALATAITAMTAGAAATAGGKAPVHAAVPAKIKAPTDGVSSAAGPQGPTGKEAPKSGSAKEQTANAGKGGAHPPGPVKLSGESVVGDQNAPKSLVLVPWKSAEIGKMPGLSMLLDDSVRPVDKGVFMRELAYYRFRVQAK